MSKAQKCEGDILSDGAAGRVPASKELSEYEKSRAKNIERNNKKLRELGLISAREEKLSNNAAWGRGGEIFVETDAKSVEGAEEEDEWIDPRRPSGARAKKRKKRCNDSIPGSRKSLRLQGISADGKELPSETPEEKLNRLKDEREETVRECREVRLRAARAVAEAGAEKAAKENPTATYEHCLMRVRTMTDKALANRVKAIERACGRHCVVKMAIFKSEPNQ
mmetsp:Transcript_45757/g.139027  ORF Transcript_45757/g.139027 Transcript_45757/m.139027 type:complete len:223 (-) Transcript_45757:268-936(-)